MRFLSFILFCIVSQCVTAQITSEELSSAKLGGSRKITIITPNGYDKKEKYPLFVVLNPHRLLEPTVSTMRYFSNSRELPPCIIVGVYNNDNEVVVPEDTGVPIHESANFFEFIGKEVIPHIEKKYSIGTFKGIIADGDAGHFINYYLLKENSLFNAYLSLNPNLLPNIDEAVANQLASFKMPIFYYLAWTENDDNVKVEKTQKLHNAIKAKSSENLVYYFGEFPKVSPEAVCPAGIPEGLNLIFSEYRPISMKEYAEKVVKINENSVKYLEDKYKEIKRLYDIDKTPLLTDIRAIYAAILKNADWESLPILSDISRKSYKGTALSDFLEGEYFYYTQNPKRAFKSYQQAFSLQEIGFVTKEILEQKLEETQKARKK